MISTLLCVSLSPGQLFSAEYPEVSSQSVAVLTLSAFTMPGALGNPPFNISVLLEEGGGRSADLIFCKIKPYKFQLLPYDQSPLANGDVPRSPGPI